MRELLKDIVSRIDELDLSIDNNAQKQEQQRAVQEIVNLYILNHQELFRSDKARQLFVVLLIVVGKSEALLKALSKYMRKLTDTDRHILLDFFPQELREPIQRDVVPHWYNFLKKRKHALLQHYQDFRQKYGKAHKQQTQDIMDALDMKIKTSFADVPRSIDPILNAFIVNEGLYIWNPDTKQIRLNMTKFNQKLQQQKYKQLKQLVEKTQFMTQSQQKSVQQDSLPPSLQIRQLPTTSKQEDEKHIALTSSITKMQKQKQKQTFVNQLKQLNLLIYKNSEKTLSSPETIHYLLQLCGNDPKRCLQLIVEYINYTNRLYNKHKRMDGHVQKSTHLVFDKKFSKIYSLIPAILTNMDKITDDIVLLLYAASDKKEIPQINQQTSNKKKENLLLYLLNIMDNGRSNLWSYLHEFRRPIQLAIIQYIEKTSRGLPNRPIILEMLGKYASRKGLSVAQLTQVIPPDQAVILGSFQDHKRKIQQLPGRVKQEIDRIMSTDQETNKKRQQVQNTFRIFNRNDPLYSDVQDQDRHILKKIISQQYNKHRQHNRDLPELWKS